MNDLSPVSSVILNQPSKQTAGIAWCQYGFQRQLDRETGRNELIDTDTQTQKRTQSSRFYLRNARDTGKYVIESNFPWLPKGVHLLEGFFHLELYIAGACSVQAKRLRERTGKL